MSRLNDGTVPGAPGARVLTPRTRASGERGWGMAGHVRPPRPMATLAPRPNATACEPWSFVHRSAGPRAQRDLSQPASRRRALHSEPAATRRRLPQQPCSPAIKASPPNPTDQCCLFVSDRERPRPQRISLDDHFLSACTHARCACVHDPCGAAFAGMHARSACMHPTRPSTGLSTRSVHPHRRPASTTHPHHHDRSERSRLHPGHEDRRHRLPARPR